jgi:PAS domain S-box-containing protein
MASELHEGRDRVPQLNREANPVRRGPHCAEADFQSLAETLSSLIALIRRDKIIYVNPAACALVGRPKEWFIDRDFWEVVHPEDREAAMARGRARTAGIPQPKRLLERLVHADGRTIWMDYSIDVLLFEGQPTTICTGHDVTEQRRAEEALRESEERFRNLCTQAPVMLMSFDPDGRIRDVSNFWLQTTGYERDEVVGKDGFGFITPDSRERLQAAIEENQRNNEVVIRNLPLQGIKKDGSVIDLLCTSVAQVGDAGEDKGAICVQINRTELQRAEEALRESEERYRALVEHAPEAIMVLDVDLGRFVDANARAEKLFGYSRERLLTMGPLDFCPQHQADRRPSCEVVEDEHRKVLEGETAVFEFTHVDASGHEIACQTRLSRLPAAGRRLIRASITDVSELKQLQEKVRHADRLAAVGVLAAGVAHEIGNPLMALSMAAQSLERRTIDDYTQKKLVLIREHIDRIARIVRQMSDLARPPSGRRDTYDLNQIVRRAVEMVRYDQRARNAEIHYALAEHLPAVEAVEDELTQVCINLALNAFDAMAGNGPDRPRRLTVRSRAVDHTVQVAFLDTGPGVPADVRPKLFQPFFTTKHAGLGSGLGLSVSYRILQEHGGTLGLDESVTEGAAFVFELPVEGEA